MMKVWQGGALAGLLTIISMIVLDAVTSWPYLVRLMISLGIALSGLLLVTKVLGTKRSVYKILRSMEITVALIFLITLTFHWFGFINVPAIAMSIAPAIMIALLIITWLVGEKQKEKAEGK